MQNISKEPARLQAEQRRIHREIVDASVNQYPAFLTAYKTNTVVQQKLRRAHKAATKLTGSLTSLHNSSSRLIPIGQQWRKDKQRTSTALGDYQKILEHLEIPQTFETCVRHEMFHEAILVLEHANLLAEKHGDLPLVQQINELLVQSVDKLVNNLISVKLAGALTLSLAIKLVTFLRKLGFAENDLRKLFLEKRSRYIQSLIADIDEHLAPYLIVSRRLSIVKVNVSEVITQYHAVFADGSTEDTYLSSMLTNWAVDQGESTIALLESLLPQIGGPELGTLIEHASHCCSAVAKVSLDISPQINQLLCSRIQEVCENSLKSGRATVRAAMATHTWKHVHVSSNKEEETNNGEEESVLTPPLTLLPFLPLAYAVNSIIATFNELRKCSATSAAETFREGAKLLLQDIADFLVDASETITEAEQAAFKMFVNAFVNDCVPFVLRCVEKLFPDTPFSSRIQRMVESVEQVLVSDSLGLETK